MYGSMVDMQSATAEITDYSREKERKKKKTPQDENIMSASATQGGHNQLSVYTLYNVYVSLWTASSGQL